MEIILIDENEVNHNIKEILPQQTLFFHRVNDFIYKLLTNNWENSIILIHSSDEAWKRECNYDNSKNNLSYAIDYLSTKNSRVILFSSGMTQYDLSKLNQTKKYKFWTFNLLNKLKVEIDWVRMLTLQINEDEAVQDILSRCRKKIDPTLIALDILLLGYLTSWLPDRILGSDWNKFGDIETWSRRREKTRKISNWFDPLKEYYSKNYKELSLGHLKLSAADNVSSVWEFIRTYTTENDKTENSKLTKMFYKGHNQFVMLSQPNKNKALLLEQDREVLNHNDVRNEFLHKLGATRADNPFEKRSEDILLFWNKLNSKDSSSALQDDILIAKEETITQGLQHWSETYRGIREFFENVPQKYGFKGTDKFEEVKKDFFEGDNSKTAIINRFVADFDKIAMKSDTQRKERLKEFFNAIDAIHTTLSDMRYGDPSSSHFYEYFQEA